MKKEVFEKAMRLLLPDADMAGIDQWVEFVTENVSLEQYIDFAPESIPVDQQAEMERWLGSLFAGLYQVEQTYSKEIAEKLWECGIHYSCLYPYEMLPMAKHLQKGGRIEDAGALIKEGLLDTAPPFFVKLEDILPLDSPYREMKTSGIITEKAPVHKEPESLNNVKTELKEMAAGYKEELIKETADNRLQTDSGRDDGIQQDGYNQHQIL